MGLTEYSESWLVVKLIVGRECCIFCLMVELIEIRLVLTVETLGFNEVNIGFFKIFRVVIALLISTLVVERVVVFSSFVALAVCPSSIGAGNVPSAGLHISALVTGITLW